MKIGRDYKHDLSFCDEKEIIEDLFTKAQNQDKGFALWKLPESDTKYLCIGLSKINNKEFDLEHDHGFVVSRFINNNDCYYLIPPELFITIDKDKTKMEGIATDAAVEEFLSSDSLSLKKDKQHSVFESSRDEYITTVKEAIKKIKQEKLKKVVVARCKKADETINNPVELFNVLAEAYPNTFVSLIHLPNEGIWIGASPELLIAIDAANTLKTIALAATQNVLPGQSTADVVWKEKEIEEQALVNRYIACCFQKFNIKDYEEAGPRTVRSGHLMHLRTDFSINLNNTLDSSVIKTSLLKLLHPTSAVCGMPKEEAVDFINQKEGFDRALYSGFLGPVNIEQTTKLFVNIRCAKLSPDSTFLYAGAGITADSDPVKEWEETDSKLQALGRFLSKS